MKQSDYKIIALGDIELKWMKVKDRHSAEEKKIIEDIWKKILRKSGKDLFNGSILNFIRMKKKNRTTEIIGNFVEYKQFLAQKEGFDSNIKIQPIAVSGITTFKEHDVDYVVFGRRAKSTTQYSGMLELVPSGGVDKKYAKNNKTIDYKENLLLELSAETGLSKSVVKKISEFVVILDTVDNVYDICCEIKVNITRKKVNSLFSKLKLKEYKSPLIFVPMDRLESYILKESDKVVPISKILIKIYMQTRKNKGY